MSVQQRNAAEDDMPIVMGLILIICVLAVVANAMSG